MFKSSHSDRGTVASAVERGCTHKTVPRSLGSIPSRCSLAAIVQLVEQRVSNP